MMKPEQNRMWRWTLGVAALSLLGACSVDRNGITIDDDLYAMLTGEDGDGGRSSGGDTSTGADSGSGATGSGGDGSGADSGAGADTGSGASMGMGGEGSAELCEAGMITCGSAVPDASDDHARYVCAGTGDDAAWMDLGASCPFVCADGNCTGECTPGESRCTGDVTIEVCSSAGLWEESDCGAQACVAGSGDGGVDACSGVCRPSTTQCSDDDNVERCDENGTWSLQTDCGGGTCDQAQCTGACTDGALQCGTNGSGDSILIACVGSAWQTEELATVCQFACGEDTGGDLACVGVCDPGSKQCDTNSTGVETCSQDAEWGTASDCTFGCNSGACRTCTPGSTECDGTGTRECDPNGEWGSTSACQFGCLDGDCFECTPGTSRCLNESTREVCNNGGEWVTASCNNKACSENSGSSTSSCVGVCSPFDTRCSGSDVQECSTSGTWVTSQSCGSCTNGACSGDCSPGDTQCAADGVTKQTCFFDMSSMTSDWSNAQTESCTNACINGDCTACQPGATTCQGTSLQQCNQDGSIGASTNCAFGCENNSCNECSDGDARCFGGGRQVCVDGNWDSPRACSSGLACYQGKCVTCVPGATRCGIVNDNDSVIEECNSEGNAWVEIESCYKQEHGPNGEFGACINYQGEQLCGFQTCFANNQTIYRETEPFDGIACPELGKNCNVLSGMCEAVEDFCPPNAYGCSSTKLGSSAAWSCQYDRQIRLALH